MTTELVYHQTTLWWFSGRILAWHASARVRFPASGSKKISFKLLSFALLANSSLKLDELSTQCGSMLYISLNLLFYPTGLFVYCGDSCYATD